MNVTFLGTNGWYDTLTGNTCSVLVQSDDWNIIFDAGNGIAKADRYIDQGKPTILFLSHCHLDHLAGLHTLTKFRFRYPLPKQDPHPRPRWRCPAGRRSGSGGRRSIA